MSTSKSKQQVGSSKPQRVQDDRGTVYELADKLAIGGQGVVFRIQHDSRLLIKVSKWPDTDVRTQAWRKQIEVVHRMPIVENDLPIAMPKTLIVKPRAGYVMELMEGLVPLEDLLLQAQEAFHQGNGLQGFVDSGGLDRRLRLLARLARVLAKLHGLAIAHGDLSPKNIFVSRSHEHAQVWLIDCDNLSYAVRNSNLQLYTPDYGAPELLRGEAGISTYTDVWSFAVMAFQLLTALHPFKGGEMVDQDSELETQALRGELPWVDHPDDERNRAYMGVSRDLVCTPALKQLFDRCFRVGLINADERPVMSEWAEVLESAAAQQVLCNAVEGCGSTFLWNAALVCPFCETRHTVGTSLRLSHFVVAPICELGEDAKPSDRWMPTNFHQVVAQQPVDLRAAPPGTSTYSESELVATVWIDGGELVIRPARRSNVLFQASGSSKLVPLPRRLSLPRNSVQHALHFGGPANIHDAWRFKW
ncbi:MAG: protein kinase [Rhodoferax ferrireducens]|uniref:Protein kinase n=1 Tax=Rhodoferax ferrireducens TaxID=192843 RepID=A0A1W9KNX1_9BURK|nr:MAG: protein kinase [Rhodoferax ferrireducens]